jgi:tetratricopeptide (TPR) repeat protein
MFMKAARRCIAPMMVVLLFLCVPCSSRKGNVAVENKDLNNPKKLLGAAFKLYQQGKLEKAMEIASYCINKNMLPADSYLLLGKCLYADKEYKNAETALQMAIKTDPRKGEAYVVLAIIAIKDNRGADAAFILRAGSPYCANNALYYFVNGSLFAGMKKYNAAARNFLQAINLNPKFRAAYGGLDYCYKQTKQEKQSEALKRFYKKNNPG